MTLIRCKVCSSPDKKKIERALLKRTKYSVIAKKYGISAPTLRKHRNEHIARDVAKSMLQRIPSANAPKINLTNAMPRINDLSSCISFIHDEVLEIYSEAKKEGNAHLQLTALKHSRECLELVLKGGELLIAAAAHTNWKRTLPYIMRAVKYHPEAKVAISEALLEAQALFTVDEALR